MAVLIRNDEGGAREDLFLTPAAILSSPAGDRDENDTEIPELQSESGGKKYRVFIGKQLDKAGLY